MKFFVSIFILTFVILARPSLGASSDSALRAELQFESEVEVGPKSNYTLMDLVNLKNASEELTTEIEHFPVNIEGLEVSSLQIRQWLMKLQEDSEIYRKESPKVQIASKILIQKQAKPSKAHFARVIKNKFSAQCLPCDLQVISLTGVERLKGADFNPDFTNLKLGSSLILPVTAQTSGSASAQQFISAQIRIRKNLWATNKQIAYNTRIEDQDLEMKMVDITFGKERPASKEAIVGALTTRSLAAGSAVFPADLKREPAVKKSQVIKAISGSADFEVSTNVTAEENGFVGDTVRVKTFEGNKILTGLVTEKGTVRLQ